MKIAVPCSHRLDAPFRPLIAAIVLVSGVAAGRAAPADRPAERFPQDKLIESLADRGMTDLLEHLLETDPPADAVDAKELIYRIHLSRWENRALDLEESRGALATGMSKIRRLIKEYPDHESRPIWQTDLAGLLLFQSLDDTNLAALFFEFGVPSVTQQRLVEKHAPEALQELSDAMQRLFILQGELPKQPEHVAARVNTGKWDRLINRYYKLRTPFFMSRACLYVAMLPATHPFFSGLDTPNPKLPVRAKTAAQERQRVIRQGIDLLDSFVEDEEDPNGVYAASVSLTARLLLEANEADEAGRLLRTLRDKRLFEEAPVTDLVGRLGAARAAAKKGQDNVASARLKELERHTLVKQDPLVRLLVVDARHLHLLAAAARMPEDQRWSAVERAYQLYDELFNDKDLGPLANDLRLYVYRRWSGKLEQERDLSALPSIMLRAAGQTTMDEAEGLYEQGSERAAIKYRQAVQIYRELRGRERMGPADDAESKFNLAMAHYRVDESNVETVKTSVRAWKDLAREMPDQQISEQAITNAASLAGTLLLVDPSDHSRRQLFIEVVEVLFDEFPRIDAADETRVTHAQNVLMPEHRFDEAATSLGMISLRSDNGQIFFTAQSELIYCLGQAAASARPGTRTVAAQQLEREARRIRETAATALDSMSDPAVIEAIYTALAECHLSLAQHALANGEMGSAITEIRRIEALNVSDEMKDVARADLIVALARSGRLDEAHQESIRLMANSPGRAAAVVYKVLSQISIEMEGWRREAQMPAVARAQREALLGRAQQHATAAVNLAAMLVEWSANQPELGQDQVTAFQLIEARARIVAGESAVALAILDRIQQTPDFANDVAVLDARGDAHFQAATQVGAAPDEFTEEQLRHLEASTRAYDVILEGLAPDETGSYPPPWWHAWMRRLSINDMLNVDTTEIPYRVRQLRLTDPDLGGEPYKTELERLENKHALR